MKLYFYHTSNVNTAWYLLYHLKWGSWKPQLSLCQYFLLTQLGRLLVYPSGYQTFLVAPPFNPIQKICPPPFPIPHPTSNYQIISLNIVKNVCFFKFKLRTGGEKTPASLETLKNNCYYYSLFFFYFFFLWVSCCPLRTHRQRPFLLTNEINTVSTPDASGKISYSRNHGCSYSTYHGCSRRNYITQRLKVVPGYIITSYLAGDYFQALRNINVPAAPMVRQQSSFIIMLEWEYSS